MQELEEFRQTRVFAKPAPVPVSVIVPVRNEARNLRRCLASLSEMGEVYVVDSQSTDDTVKVAEEFGAQVIQFRYRGGWPKKRQWAMETLPIVHDWIFLIDADEALTPELTEEIRQAIQVSAVDGYYLSLQMFFLGSRLRHSGASFYKLSLFRRNKGRFECRLRDQETNMSDVEVHEHVMVDGRTSTLKNPLIHHNVESLSHYIHKHDEYSNWEARVWLNPGINGDQLQPTLFGNQAQRRRWLRKQLFLMPGSSILLFLYKYVFRLGFLDGVPGLIYCGLQGVQFFHSKAKIYELHKRGVA